VRGSPSPIAAVTAPSPIHTSSAPRLSLRIEEAAAALGVGPDWFREHVLPDVRAVRVSPRVRLIPVPELVKWLDRNATRVLE
jgi:hypothetical protein